MTRFARLFLALITASSLSVGCGSLLQSETSVTGGAPALPDLPQITRAVVAGERLDFQGVTITVDAVDMSADSFSATVTLSQKGKTSTLALTSGEYGAFGDLLLRLRPRNKDDQASSGVARLKLYHAPSMTPKGKAEFPIEREIAEGEPWFLPGGGFIAIESILDNDFMDRTDDRARLFARVGSRGEAERLNLTEFHARPLGDAVIFAGNIYTGRSPGDGSAFLRVAEAETAYPAKAETFTVIPGMGMETPEPIRSVDVLPRPEAPLVIVGIGSGDQSTDAFLDVGESMRWGDAEVKLDSLDDSGLEAVFTLYRHREAVWPDPVLAPGLVVSEKKEEKSPEPNQSTRVTRTLRVGESVEFWGARFELTRVYDNDRTSLSDDSAEFLVENTNGTGAHRVREGNRDTIYGSNRWWILHVDRAEPDTNPARGKAVIILSTGTFFRMDERNRGIGIQP